jgi:hypothetical protein
MNDPTDKEAATKEVAAQIDTLIWELKQTHDQWTRGTIAGLLAKSRDIRAAEPMIHTLLALVGQKRAQESQDIVWPLVELLQAVAPQVSTRSLEMLAAIENFSQTVTVFEYGGASYEATDHCDVSALKTTVEQELRRRSSSQASESPGLAAAQRGKHPWWKFWG